MVTIPAKLLKKMPKPIWKKEKVSTILKLSLTLMVGISPFVKRIISFEKYYLCKSKSCEVKVEKMLENNHLPFKTPKLSQLQNYLYRYKQDLIAQNYPEVKAFLTEVCQKTFHEGLAEDEMFYLHSEFKDGKPAIIFSSKALLKNLIKQASIQPMFIHLDCTFKLIDLGLPLMVIGTENINHNFRPIAFFMTWSESTKYVKLLLAKLSIFYQEKFNFEFRPLYIMTDNSDAFIAGCRHSFTHEYVHMGCHFHIAKRMKDKTQGGELKDHKGHIFFGVKCLKNSCSVTFFHNTWKIVSQYWKQKNVPQKFIDSFETEYIKKNVQWHYGSSFPGKSRTNNSLESGNNILKKFFNRRAHNIKEFLGKMREFITEWSTGIKTAFPIQFEYKKEILKAGEDLARDIKFVYFEEESNLLYSLRKGICSSEDEIAVALEQMQNRPLLPKSIDELFVGWCNFRTLNKLDLSCDCCEYFKYKYCKHLIALNIKEGRIANPVLEKKKTPGRKAKISAALKR